MIYIGLLGTSSRPLSSKAVPNGTGHLSPQALKLYEGFGKAIQQAVS